MDQTEASSRMGPALYLEDEDELAEIRNHWWIAMLEVNVIQTFLYQDEKINYFDIQLTAMDYMLVYFANISCTGFELSSNAK